MHFWSVLTTTDPAINQFLYYSALLENFMQSKTSSKQATTVLVNRTTSTSGALERDGCIMCYPNPLKQPCSNFRKKLNLLLYVGETLFYTLAFKLVNQFQNALQRSDGHFNTATSQPPSSKLLFPQKDFWGLLPSVKCRKLCIPWWLWENTAIEEALSGIKPFWHLKQVWCFIHPLFTSMLEGLTFMGTPHPALPLYRG